MIGYKVLIGIRHHAGKAFRIVSRPLLNTMWESRITKTQVSPIPVQSALLPNTDVLLGTRFSWDSARRLISKHKTPEVNRWVKGEGVPDLGGVSGLQGEHTMWESLLRKTRLTSTSSKLASLLNTKVPEDIFLGALHAIISRYEVPEANKWPK